MREEPDGAHAEEVDEVAEIGEEVVVAAPVVGVVPDWHEVEQLCCIPVVEILGVSSNQVAADEDVQDTTDEGDFLAQSDGLGIVPPFSESVNAVAHLLPVSVQLLVCRWHPSSPFFHNALLCSRTS